MLKPQLESVWNPRLIQDNKIDMLIHLIHLSIAYLSGDGGSKEIDLGTESWTGMDPSGGAGYWFLGGASCSMVQRSLPCPAEFDRGLQKCWRGQPWSNRWKTHLEKRYRDDPTGRLWENTRCDLLFLRASTARWKTFLGMVCIGICSTRSEGCWVLLWTLVVGKRWDGASTHWKGAFFGSQHFWTLSVWSKILKLHHIEITRDFDRTPKQLGDVSFEKKLDAWRGMMYIIWWIRFQLAI